MTEALSQASETGAEEVTVAAVEQDQLQQEPQQGVEDNGGKAEAADPGNNPAATDQDADGV